MNNAALIAETIALLQPFSPVRQALPPDIADIRRAEQHGELSLQNQFLTVAGVGELRSASVQSAKVQIVNFLFFPAADTQLPVYVVEFVELSGQPIVAVLDAKCLLPAACESQVTALLQQAKADAPVLSAQTQMPDWYLAACSGHDIFARSPSPAQMDTLMRLHLQIWRGLISLFSQPSRYSETEATLQAEKLRHYKTQHRLHYPGIPLLNRCFGTAWTEAYLNNYLFK